jgi:hypothetical protein
MMMDILALIIALGLGFGLSCFLFASLLSRSNDIGNNVGEASRYTVGIEYDITTNNLSDAEVKSFGRDYITEEDRTGTEPDMFTQI